MFRDMIELIIANLQRCDYFEKKEDIDRNTKPYDFGSYACVFGYYGRRIFVRRRSACNAQLPKRGRYTKAQSRAGRIIAERK